MGKAIAALPPPVEGTLTGRGRDAARLWRLEQTGLWFQVGSTAATTRERVGAAIMGILTWVTAPTLIPTLAAVMRFRRRTYRYYLSADRTAIIGVLARRDGWTVADHFTAHPGSGEGAALRALVCPVLVAAADHAGVPITLNASTVRTASLYAAAFPGLADVGPAWPYGRKMRRNPC